MTIEYKKVRDVCSFVKGKKPKKLGSKDSVHKIPYINIKAFETQVIDEYAEEGKYTFCDRDDLLMVWDGARCGLVGTGAQGYVGSTLSKITSNLHESKFLFYFFQSLYEDINKRGKGVGIPHVDPMILGDFDIPIISKENQKKVVRKIDSLFSEIESGVDELKKTKTNLELYKQSVLNAAIQGKLVPQDPDDEPASKLLERIRAEKEALINVGKLRKEKPLPPIDLSKVPFELPKGWEWVRISSIAANKKYAMGIGPFGSNLKVSDYRNGGVPLIFVRNIRSNYFGEEKAKYVTVTKANELDAHSAEGGDVLVTKMGEPPGDACVYPENFPKAIITSDCIKVSVDSRFVCRNFLSSVINSPMAKPQILEQTRGVAQKKVSLERFRNLLVPLPPIKEQKRIQNYLEAVLQEISHESIQVDRFLGQVQSLQQSVLKSAFNGKLL